VPSGWTFVWMKKFWIHRLLAPEKLLPSQETEYWSVGDLPVSASAALEEGVWINPLRAEIKQKRPCDGK